MDGFGGLTSLQGINRPVHSILQGSSDIEYAAPSGSSSALYSSNMERCSRIDIIQCNLWHVIALAPMRLQIIQQSQASFTFNISNGFLHLELPLGSGCKALRYGNQEILLQCEQIIYLNWRGTEYDRCGVVLSFLFSDAHIFLTIVSLSSSLLILTRNA